MTVYIAQPIRWSTAVRRPSPDSQQLNPSVSAPPPHGLCTSSSRPLHILRTSSTPPLHGLPTACHAIYNFLPHGLDADACFEHDDISSHLPVLSNCSQLTACNHPSRSACNVSGSRLAELRTHFRKVVIIRLEDELCLRWRWWGRKGGGAYAHAAGGRAR